MVFNATSWGAKLLMQAAYNTKARPVLGTGRALITRSCSAHVPGSVLQSVLGACSSSNEACASYVESMCLPPLC